MPPKSRRERADTRFFPGASAVSEGCLAFVFVARVTSAMNYYTFVKMKMLQELEAGRGGAGIYKRCRSNGCKRSACLDNYGCVQFVLNVAGGLDGLTSRCVCVDDAQVLLP